MKRHVFVLFLAGVLLLAGCGDQDKKPQYEATEPVIAAGA